MLQMKIRAYIAVVLLYIAITFAGSCFAWGNSSQLPRVALIYSDRLESPSPKDDYDGICGKLGWVLGKWENRQVSELIKKLDTYDVVICGRQYNLANKQNFAIYAQEWKAFLERGGIILVAPVMDSDTNWIHALGSGFLFKTESSGGGGQNTVTNPNADMSFEKVVSRWAAFKDWSSEWSVANSTPEGMPIVMYQRVGKGIILVSTAYRAGNSSWSFPSEKDLSSIWNYMIMERNKASSVEVSLLSWGDISLGENNASVDIKNLRKEAIDIVINIGSVKNREITSCNTTVEGRIAAEGSKAFSIPYRITSDIPDFLFLTVAETGKGTYFRTWQGVNIEDLKRLIESINEKNGKIDEGFNSIRKFCEKIPSLGWMVAFANRHVCEKGDIDKILEKLEKQVIAIAAVGDKQAWKSKSLAIHDVLAKINTEALKVEIMKKRLKSYNGLESQLIARTAVIARVTSPYDKIFFDQPFSLSSSDSLKFKMAANEYENAQLVLIPISREVKNINIYCSDLKDVRGRRITAGNIKVWRVGYVYEQGKWYPDPLIPCNETSIEANKVVQPFWVTVHTPPGTIAGEYTGVLTVRTGQPEQSISVPISVSVWDFEVPRELNFPTDVTLRVNLLARFFFGDKAAEEPEKYISPQLCRKYMEFLLSYRLTPTRPWSFEGSALAGIPYLGWKEKNGRWLFDFKEYDKNIQLILNKGGKMFCAATLPGVHLAAGMNSEKLNFLSLDVYIPKIYEHLKKKGWLSKAYFYGWDEPSARVLDKVQAEAVLCKQLAPEVKILVPYNLGNVLENGHEDCADIWVPMRGLWRKSLEALRVKDKIVWGYQCGGATAGSLYGIPGPNIDKYALLWVVEKLNLEGFLFWGTVSPWRYNGINDIERDGTPKISWRSGFGDGLLAYPAGHKPEDGLNPSLRLELLRDGLEMWEYFHLLKLRIGELERNDKKDEKDMALLIKESKSIIKISDDLVKDEMTYSNDHERYAGKRALIAEKLEKINSCLKKRSR